MSFSIDLSNRTVIITGVSSGIGAGIARMFAKANANISGCSLEPLESEGVQHFMQAVKEESGKMPLYVQTDVTKLADLENFVAKTVECYGSINILASNAGANVFMGAEHCNQEEWLHNQNLNLESHWNIARLCKPFLENDGNGVIIINTSSHAFNTIAGSFPYNIAKAGLKALVQTLTIEWGPGIRTVGIAPGLIKTRLAEEWFQSFPDPIAARQKIEDFYPLKRIGTPEEIGGWFVFLSSPYAAFSGGQTYLIDGGRSSIMMEI